MLDLVNQCVEEEEGAQLWIIPRESSLAPPACSRHFFHMCLVLSLDDGFYCPEDLSENHSQRCSMREAANSSNKPLICGNSCLDWSLGVDDGARPNHVSHQLCLQMEDTVANSEHLSSNTPLISLCLMNSRNFC